ncbi:bolA-like protein DDB_G0274169 [Diachasma alloeum]|uniref:bolA-like protein DDB_G0274169 n=1 Tax=Diachasma alloeum TaxID=454923 RepID=UPI000738152D|nr:bolA-like protein DDB_G0274169 [Diachasma alloeum]
MNKFPNRSIPLILRTLTKMTGVDKPIENSIRVKLEKGLSPSFLEIFNESYMHNVPEGSETHFKVVVVSEQFSDQPLIKRHRMVNELLQHELENGVHALSIVAKTPAQWEQSSQTVSPSPACRGGFGK